MNFETIGHLLGGKASLQPRNPEVSAEFFEGKFNGQGRLAREIATHRKSPPAAGNRSAASRGEAISVANFMPKTVVHPRNLINVVSIQH
jgi:hypothetical protein